MNANINDKLSESYRNKILKDGLIKKLDVLRDAVIHKNYDIIQDIDIPELVEQVKNAQLSKEEKDHILHYLDGFVLDGDEHNLLTLDSDYNTTIVGDIDELLTVLHNL